MEIHNIDQFCAPAAKPRLAMSAATAATLAPAAATTAGVVAAWSGAAVRKHDAFATRCTTGLPAWSPPTC